MMVALIIAGWLACGVLAAGFLVAWFQGFWPSIAAEMYHEDLGESLCLGLLLGPLALILSILMTGFCKHGWHLTRRKQP